MLQLLLRLSLFLLITCFCTSLNFVILSIAHIAVKPIGIPIPGQNLGGYRGPHNPD